MRLAPLPALVLLAAPLAGCVQTIWLADTAAPPATVTEACEAGPRETVRVDVTFPARDAGCAWGEDDNRAEEQGVLTARAEESVALDLADVALCDLGFDFGAGGGGEEDDEPTLRYDDGFLLTFGDVVLVASYAPVVGALETDGHLRLYDWDRLAGLPLGFADADTYCLGDAEGLSTCTIPPAETSGTFAIAFADTLVAEVAERAHAAGDYRFGFVTYGDNDPTVDCSHSEFAFSVDVTSVPF